VIPIMFEFPGTLAVGRAVVSVRQPPSRALLAVPPLAGGPMVGRHAGQRLARSELAEMTFWERILNWLAHLPTNAGRIVPGGWFGLIALAVLAVLAVALVFYWVRPTRTRRAQAESVLGGAPMSARDYRRSAERLADAGEYAGAIVDGVRAIAADLEERSILPPRPGRTAGELASEASRELPDLTGDLQAVMQLFADVRYGDKEVNLAGYQLVTRVDKEVSAARPTAASGPHGELASFGVPQ
jgi:type II secretory pathway pseudopilin PulG